MQRISIIGTSASGKTTLARNISNILDIPCIELDAIHWLPNWTSLPDDKMQEHVAKFVKNERWVIEGRYFSVCPLVWEHADTVIWLDYPLPLILSRLIKRTTIRVLTGEELWAGNKETLQRTFSRNSIIRWCIKTYHQRRTTFETLLYDPVFRHLEIHHFQSPEETEAFVYHLKMQKEKEKDTIKKKQEPALLMTGTR